MNPFQITSETTHGNLGLEKVLRAIVAQLGMTFVGNIYLVANSTDPNIVRFNGSTQEYADGSLMVQPTVEAAYAATVTERNDVILISSNGTSNKVAAMVTVAKNRVHFVGLDPLGRKIGSRALISNTGAGAATDVSMIKITGTGNSFRNLSLKNNWTVSQNLSSVLDYGANTYFENCDIENLGSAHLTNNAAASLILAAAESIYKNCTIGENTLLVTSTGGQQVLIQRGTSARAATRCVFENCIFQSYTSDTTHVFIKADTSGSIDRYVNFKDCDFINVGANVSNGVTLAVGVQTASSLGGYMNFFRPNMLLVTNLATSAIGNTGVYVVSPVLAAAASDCVAVQAS